MVKIRSMALAALVAVPLAAGQAWAESANPYRMGGGDEGFLAEDPEEWKEAVVALPPYPKKGDLMELPSDVDRYDLFIDAKNLTLGEDGVTRYTLVIRSNSGAENVFFEGLRCVASEYRGYGYGTSDGKVHEFAQPEWKPVRTGDVFGFRFDLARFYFCDSRTLPLPKEKILDRIRYAEESPNTSVSSSIFE